MDGKAGERAAIVMWRRWGKPRNCLMRFAYQAYDRSRPVGRIRRLRRIRQENTLCFSTL